MMERRYYKCTFLSDIILNSNSATEGHSESLDYIPGSNFLGIVARHYIGFNNETAYEIFHSGKVHFGDGHLLINCMRSLKRPASWFHLKTDVDQKEIYLHHKITKKIREDFSNNSKQLKQIRSGFFQFENDKIISKNIQHTYSIKSAHDLDKRRSKDEAMYGYDALNKGTEWIFFVDAESEIFEMIEENLIGEKIIGRSKTAQYGRIKIESLGKYKSEIDTDSATDFNNDAILLIYFDSCAAFLDEYQQPTYQPSIDDLKLTKGCDIDWSLSQIRTKNYSPWNSTRKTRDFDRVCIDKGSVIAVKIPNDFEYNNYCEAAKFGIGLFKNEGLGQVLINPIFLTKTTADAKLDYTFKSDEQSDLKQPVHIIEKGTNDDFILKLLSSFHKKKEEQLSVLEQVNTFLKVNAHCMGEIKSSQWGQVRVLAMRSKTKQELIDLLFKKGEGFLVSGKAEKQWKKHTEEFKLHLDSQNFTDEQLLIQYVINICSEMAKRVRKEGK